MPLFNCNSDCACIIDDDGNNGGGGGNNGGGGGDGGDRAMDMMMICDGVVMDG